MRHLSVAATVAALLLVFGASPAAAADPEWRLDTAAADDINAGGKVLIDAWVENTGAVPLSGELTITDTFPIGLVPVDPLVGGTVSGFSCSGVAGQTSTCTVNVDGLVPGGQVRFRYPTNIAADATGTLLNTIEVSGGGMFAAAAEQQSMSVGPPGPFGIKEFAMEVIDGVGSPAPRAGSVPREIASKLAFRSVASEAFKIQGENAPIERFKDTYVPIPAGVVGDPTATPIRCTPAQLAESSPDSGSNKISNCPQDSQVGIVRVLTQVPGFGPDIAPVYNMVPPPGSPAAFGFSYNAITVVFVAKLRAADNGIDIVALTPPSSIGISAVGVTFWGVPADSSHDTRRHFCIEGYSGNLESKTCPSGAARKPFLRLPTSCPGTPLPWSAEVTTYIHPSTFVHAETSTPGTEDCESVPFEPSLAIAPSTSAASAPSGLDATLEMPQTFRADRIAQADVRRVEVRLPDGMVINPSSADGLGACSDADLRLGINGVATCPDNSKIGTVDVGTPLLDHPLSGSVFLRSQASGDPASGDLFRVALEIRSDDDGIDIKLPGRVKADPTTGRLTATFDELPQLPFDSVALHLDGGVRAPLSLPKRCGTYSAETEITGWNGKMVSSSIPFTLDQDCAGGGFKPAIEAGVESARAGAHSPFHFRLTRKGGEEEVSSLAVRLPEGLLATLKGVSLCPQEAIDAARTLAPGQGATELASPHCPASSQVGTVVAGAGSGPLPFYLKTGRVYFAGPYKGAPYSLAVVTPALAGPFDLGNVVVRTALHIDRSDAHVTVVSDPIPTIVAGVPLNLRDLRIAIDRPGYTLNPTSCEPKTIEAAISSSAGTNARRSTHFQVGNCARLGFKPKLSLRLRGGTERSQFPALRAVLRMPKARGANIKRASVALPGSEFLAQSHIRTICTRVQFAADKCPKGSVYGYARAFSPLLDYPLYGPVYLRSSDNPLPDLVAALDGQIEIDLVGRIDTDKRGGIRTTFAKVPDAPVSRFVLNMKGGRKGLLENSVDLCNRRHRATVAMDAHNGKIHDFRPVVEADCGKRKGKRKSSGY